MAVPGFTTKDKLICLIGTYRKQACIGSSVCKAASQRDDQHWAMSAQKSKAVHVGVLCMGMLLFLIITIHIHASLACSCVCLC